MDLKELFGSRYVVTLDPSCGGGMPDDQTGPEDGESDWECWEIKGKRGQVYSYSETSIAVLVSTRAARRLARLIGANLVLLQHADDEMCFKADAKHAESIVRFIKPKSRRQLTDVHKAVLAARLSANRFRRWESRPAVVP
jgi:hypothetical protein